MRNILLLALLCFILFSCSSDDKPESESFYESTMEIRYTPVGSQPELEKVMDGSYNHQTGTLKVYTDKNHSYTMKIIDYEVKSVVRDSDPDLEIIDQIGSISVTEAMIPSGNTHSGYKLWSIAFSAVELQLDKDVVLSVKGNFKSYQ